MDEATMRAAASVLRALAQVRHVRAEYVRLSAEGDFTNRERAALSQEIAAAEKLARDAIAVCLGGPL